MGRVCHILKVLAIRLLCPIQASHIPLDEVSAPVLYLHLCLAPFSMSAVPTRDDVDVGKFKLLSVMAFPVGVSTAKGGGLVGRIATPPARAHKNRTLLLG